MEFRSEHQSWRHELGSCQHLGDTQTIRWMRLPRKCVGVEKGRGQRPEPAALQWEQLREIRKINKEDREAMDEIRKDSVLGVKKRKEGLINQVKCCLGQISKLRTKECPLD